MEELQLKVGVLIIGSLWWEGTESYDPKGRFQWRNESLCDNYSRKSFRVYIPIRYGRYSSQDNIYTMVFSTASDSEIGIGYAASLRLNVIRSTEELKREVLKMASAEGMTKGFIGGGPRDGAWATMGILINPKHDSSKLKKQLLEWWGNQVLQSSESHNQVTIQNDLSSYKLDEDPRSVLSPNGEIQISWPQIIDQADQAKFDEFDLVFATCTKPKTQNQSSTYPTPEQIATLVNLDVRSYFKNNVASGIATFQDKLIQSHL